jgi:hypothetical protein
VPIRDAQNVYAEHYRPQSLLRRRSAALRLAGRRLGRTS